MTLKLSSGNIDMLIYQRLIDVVPDMLTIKESGKSEVEGLVPLNLEFIQRTPEKVVIALSHYYQHESGNMIADPDMEIAIYIDRGWPRH